MTALTTATVAAVAATVATGALVRLLPRWGLLDIPNHRSSHARPVPRGGGLGLIMGCAVASAFAAPNHLLVVGLLGALLAAVLGLADDLRSLPAAPRLLVQFVVSVTAAALLVRATDLTAPIAVLVACVVTVWLTGYINVFNFMDGSNGLAAANALIAGVTFLWIGASEENTTLRIGGALLLGTAAGFLPWNFPRARIFLGDVGSYSLGFLIAWLAVVGALTTDDGLLCFAPTVVVLLDTSLTLARRARRGASLTVAHREHVYQRLTTTPGSPLPALVISAFSAAFVGAAALPSPWSLTAWALLVPSYVACPRFAHAS